MRLRRGASLPLTTDLRLALSQGPGAWGLGGRFSERQLRAAWEAHHDELLSQPHDPGTRPWAWWRFEAGREEVFEPDMDDPDYGARSDDAEAESFGFLAAGGELLPDEIAALRDRANKARARIGTDAARETTGMGAAHGPDHLAVKIWAAIEAAQATAPRDRARGESGGGGGK